MSYHPPPPQPLGAPPAGIHLPPGLPPPGSLPGGLPPPPPFPGPPGFPPPPMPPPGTTVPPTIPTKPPIAVPGVPPLGVPPGLPLLPTPTAPSGRTPYKHENKQNNNNQNQNQANSTSTTTVFVGNITERASDALIRQILTKCGVVVNWKRVQGAKGKLQAFGFCDYGDPESGLRSIRLLHNKVLGDKALVVKVDAKTKTYLDEYKAEKKKEMKKNAEEKKKEDGEADDDEDDDNDDLDGETLVEDTRVKKAIEQIILEHSDILNRKLESEPYRATHSGSEQNLEGLDMDNEKKSLVSREIRSFRDTYRVSSLLFGLNLNYCFFSLVAQTGTHWC